MSEAISGVCLSVVTPHVAALMRATAAVMAELVPAIHVFAAIVSNKTWMPATSAGMTLGSLRGR
jgi:hypothetical protein